jgi:cell division septum initiation protein DivIVA
MRDETSLSEVEPELGAIDAYELAQDEPPFPLVIRGYDRRSVDEYLDAASARLAELEALQSPSLAVKEAVERVADDTGSILKTAHETADGIVTRARDQAEQTVLAANEQAELTVASAEARARQLVLDTDALWQERMRLIEDVNALSVQLAELADAAAARFPAEEPEEPSVVAAEPMDEVVEQPTEALDVNAMWAAEDAEAGEEAEAVAEDDERSVPEGLDDLEPPPEFR